MVFEALKKGNGKPHSQTCP